MFIILKKMRHAFTIIEILVSVIIISGSIIYALKIYSQNHAQIIYISERNKHTLQDSLFLAEETIKYHQNKKTAYDLVNNIFNVQNSKTKEYLKEIYRTFYIPETIQLQINTNQKPKATINEIIIKNHYSASYFHFKINTF
jgi:type II secretory pathway pseudopilin PulG